MSTCSRRPRVHDRDAVAHRHRLHLVVRDVDRRHVEPPLELVDLRPHLHAQLGVEVRERLVHQERLRLSHECAAHRDALALPARESLRLALQVLLDLQGLRRVPDALLDLLLRHLVEPKAEGQIVLDRHVRVERVALEDHRDVAFLRSQVVDDLVADQEVAVGDLLEACDHPQCRRLATAGRSYQDHQLAVLDPQVEVEHRLGAVVVDLLDVVELDRRQGRPSAGRDYELNPNGASGTLPSTSGGWSSRASRPRASPAACGGRAAVDGSPRRRATSARSQTPPT